MDIDEPPRQGELPPDLRFLRILVTVLTGTMIVGVLVIIALLVIRLAEDRSPDLPESVALPAGTKVSAVTRGDGWFAVVTGDRRILIFDGAGTLLQEVEVKTAE